MSVMHPFRRVVGSIVLGFLAAGCACAAGSLTTTRIGIFYSRPAAISLGHALGVHYERFGMAVFGANGAQLERIRAAEAAGFGLNIQFTNVEAGERGVKPGPVTDDAAFEAALGADLDAARPELVTIQNEEDGQDFWSGTTADYLHELTDAVRVAHARGYRISNGGLTSMGVKLAYWHHLWLTGQRRAADQFAADALTPALNHGLDLRADVPNSSDPGRAVLGRNAAVRAKLARAEALISGYPATGVDYVNFHWYENGPEDLRAVATWLGQATNLPVICNEMGQFSDNPDTVTALLAEAVSLRLPYVFWFAPDARQGVAVGLADDDGTPRANGAAFRAFVAAHP